MPEFRAQSYFDPAQRCWLTRIVVDDFGFIVTGTGATRQEALHDAVTQAQRGLAAHTQMTMETVAFEV